MDTTTTLLIVLLILIAVCIAGNAYYFFVFKKKTSLFTLSKSKVRKFLPFFNVALLLIALGIIGYVFAMPASVVSTSIKSGEAWKNYDDPFVVVFDRPINKAKTQLAFSKEIKGEWKYEKANALDIFKRKAVFSPIETLLPEEKVVFTSSSKPLLLSKSASFSSDFISGTSQPKIFISDDIKDRQNVNPSQEIVIDLPDVNPHAFLLNYESTPALVYKDERLDDVKIKVTHDIPFKNGEAYDFKVFITPVTYNTKTFEVLTKGEKKEVSAIKFTAAPTPNIKAVSPKGENVLSSEQVTVEFDQEMNKESVEKGLKFEPAIEGTYEWNPESTFVTFKPSKTLNKDTSYKISLHKDIQSIYGAKLVQTLNVLGATTEAAQAPTEESKEFTFKTIGSVGVARTSPVSNSSNVDINTSFSVTFTQAVDKASAESKISINPSVPGKFSWNDSTVTFKPDKALEYSKRYTVTVAAGVKSIDGLDFKSNYQFNFTTKTNTVILNAPVINQSYAFSCNVTAAAIALRYKGTNVSPNDVYNAIPKQSVPKKDGFWGNPHLGFVGNINGPDGYGVYWGPLANAINGFRSGSAEIKSGWNVTDLLREIDKGNPSIVYWQNGYANPTRLSWKSYDANGNVVTINGVNGMHSEVVIGYVGSPENPSQIIISDPWASRWGNRYRYINVGSFKGLWGYFNNTAVVVR
jgi:uncharacterized protein YvpB